ncbi:MAG TPA: Fic family protein [Acidiferrobacter sp.]|nr:Fic family protein [Acidiferrobacter sp.]
MSPPFSDLLGYAWLESRLALKNHLPLTDISLLAGAPDPSVQTTTGVTVRRWHKNYALPENPLSHLTFALRYEPLRQDLLKALFHALGPNPLRHEVEAHPKSRWAALAGFYYERLLGDTLDCPGSQATSQEALSPEAYFTAAPVLNKRWRIQDTLPGSPGFCPLVRRTPFLNGLSDRLRALLPPLITETPIALLERAGYYLALKETRASFAIERETPSPDRARRFLQVLNQAGRGEITPERLVAIQNTIIDNPLMKTFVGAYRTETAYVGETRRGPSYAGWEHIHFIAPPPDQVDDLMRDWHTALTRPAQDALAAAAAVAFGLVYIHPFPDGNGRVHRFLLQHILAQQGSTPPGVTVPVSVWLQRHPRAYDAALEAFSQPLMQVMRYTLDTEGVVTTQTDLSDAYRYFDATAQAECLGTAVESVLTHDLPEEIAFLQTYDAAQARLKAVIDLPDREMDIAIHTILRAGHMSKTKRDRFFPQYSEETLARMERAVLASPGGAQSDSPPSDPGDTA